MSDTTHRQVDSPILGYHCIAQATSNIKKPLIFPYNFLSTFEYLINTPSRIYDFDVQELKVKCSFICPWENKDCYMTCLLSKQNDFSNQPSMLEALIKNAGYEWIFPSEIHCELYIFFEMISVFHKFICFHY